MITFEELLELFQQIDLPVAYHEFPIGYAPDLPFIVYDIPNRNDFAADNRNFAPVSELTIELYTETKDFTLEYRIEQLIPFPYTKTETFIDTEHMYQISYESEVIITNVN